MSKPKNRKERIEFIVKKYGQAILPQLAMLTDSEIKSFFEGKWNDLKHMPDETPAEPEVICLRCKNFVVVEHHFYCGCGEDRAVFDEEMWRDDIESHNGIERCKGDEEFILNGYRAPCQRQDTEVL